MSNLTKTSHGELITSQQPSECSCATCQKACENKPGWFLPGEVEDAAKLIGMETQAFFDAYLSVDYWDGGIEGDDDIFVLSPAVEGAAPGEMFGRNPRGRCVFFKNGKCEIHAAKPFECRVTGHHDAPGDLHEAVAAEWEKRGQSEVKRLYPEPEASGGWSIFDEFAFGGLR